MLPLLSSSGFIPHDYCYRWQPALVWLHLLADSITALAYYAISCFLIAFARQRSDWPFRSAFWFFGAFIVACGTTHLMDVWTLWHPDDWLAGGIKAATAISSLLTVVVLYRLFPVALAIPNPTELIAVKQQLQAAMVEHNRTEAALRQCTARLRASQRMANLGDWESDPLSQTTLCSEEFLRLLGLPPSPEPIATAKLWSYFTPASQARLAAAKAQAAETGADYEIELEYTRDDTPAWLLVRGEVVRNATGAVVKRRGIAIDITARKRLEAEQQQLHELKDEFLSMTSHELRTPLTSIRLATEMLSIMLEQCTPALTPTFPQHVTRMALYLQILLTQCDRELQLVNELLELQRIEADAIELQPQPVDLSTWLPQLLEPYYERTQHRQQTLHLTLSTRQQWLYTDPKLLSNVLHELLTNACKYTPPAGTITVNVIRLSDGERLPQLHFCVSNTGPVLPAEALAHLFDKFYRVPGRDQWQQGGTGLGLALVKRQIDCLGGSITVRSDPAATTFTVALPLPSV